jgi:hypothetical protein
MQLFIKNKMILKNKKYLESNNLDKRLKNINFKMSKSFKIIIIIYQKLNHNNWNINMKKHFLIYKEIINKYLKKNAIK